MNLWDKECIWVKGHINWLSDYFKELQTLQYMREDFNDIKQISSWVNKGFSPRTGLLYDMRNEQQPLLTNRLIDYTNSQGLENVGVSYYKMSPGDNLPYHSDLYSKYIKLFNLELRKQNIIRYIFFPQDRLAGHIFEINGQIIDWKAGDWVAWRYDTPHLAANFGYDDRYSIQVTGVLHENI